MDLFKLHRALVRWAWPRGGLARGRRALARGKPLLALKEWTAASAAGSAESAYKIARLYFESRGVIFSAIEAKRWLETAARGGHRQAQFELGRLLLGGGAEGQAERWAARARERGETDSEDASLKAMFPHGLRFESDPVEAVRLLTEAAN